MMVGREDANAEELLGLLFEADPRFDHGLAQDLDALGGSEGNPGLLISTPFINTCSTIGTCVSGMYPSSTSSKLQA